jgi:hypothetical protein
MTRKALACHFSGLIFLDHLAKEAETGVELDYDVEQELIENLHDIEFVNETCFAHGTYVVCNFETENGSEAQRRAESIYPALEECFKRYRRDLIAAEKRKAEEDGA